MTSIFDWFVSSDLFDLNESYFNDETLAAIDEFPDYDVDVAILYYRQVQSFNNPTTEDDWWFMPNHQPPLYDNHINNLNCQASEHVCTFTGG